SLPLKRGLFGFEESIDHDRAFLSSISPSYARRFATDDGGAAIHCDASGVGKHNMTAERNALWIDRAVSGAQTRTIRTGTELAFAGPVNSDSRKQRTFGRKNRSRGQKSKAKSY